MAEWCLLTKQSPDAYRGLNRGERQAFIDAGYRLGMIEEAEE